MDIESQTQHVLFARARLLKWVADEEMSLFALVCKTQTQRRRQLVTINKTAVA